MRAVVCVVADLAIELDLPTVDDSQREYTSARLTQSSTLPIR
ncbi:MAG: hypothetical protein ABSB26_04760 [Nitrososphaerales archaeon]